MSFILRQSETAAHCENIQLTYLFNAYLTQCLKTLNFFNLVGNRELWIRQ